ncbi:unnamed protein product, partial [Allacma fusca]
VGGAVLNIGLTMSVTAVGINAQRCFAGFLRSTLPRNRSVKHILFKLLHIVR